MNLKTDRESKEAQKRATTVGKQRKARRKRFLTSREICYYDTKLRVK